MEIEPTRTEREYYATLARITQLMGEKEGTVASSELEGLVTVVDTYESEHFPMDEPDPEALRRFLLKQQGLVE